MLLLLTQRVFFLEIHVVLHLGRRATSGPNTTYLHLENSDYQEVLLQKSNSILTEKQGARYYSF
jgi:hypothetical protein